MNATTEEAVGLIAATYPSAWKEAAKTADFDVIAATLDRLQAAAATGDWNQAESARLEAYGVFELGPEQRLRGLAPALFQEVEGYFWYGAGGHDGLVQLLGRRATNEEIAATRTALDDALARSEQQIGSGPQSEVSVVTNAAIIVFREGLEAVLILAALMASLVGRKRHFRRPLLAGVGLALVASALTWVVAQTVLTSLALYGEKLEAIVSLVAIGVLLLILNWFYHRVYWQENLQNLHQRKRRVLAGAGLSLAAAQIVGLVLLGFSSVYREGFETVLFLQAMTLEAGPLTVLRGVALGLAGVIAVFVLVIRLERKLPRKKMLVATGPSHHLGARRHGRNHGADTAEGWLGRRRPDRGPRASVLDWPLARHLPDLAGRHRPMCRARVRTRKLRRRGAGSRAEAIEARRRRAGDCRRPGPSRGDPRGCGRTRAAAHDHVLHAKDVDRVLQH